MKIDLFNSDSLIKLKEIPSKSVDLVLTDPPYGINYKNWDLIEFYEFTHDWVNECSRVLKDNGTMWSFMSIHNLFYNSINKTFGFIDILNIFGHVHLENLVTWARQKGRCSSKHLKSTREEIVHFTKNDKVFTWNDIKVLREVIAPYMQDGKPRGWFVDEHGKRMRWTGLGNVWTYTSPLWSSKFPDDQLHSAQRPFMMIERLLLLSSNENDVVLDPFMGVGTTGIACKKHKRNFIGIEKDENYFNKAYDRIINKEISNA